MQIVIDIDDDNYATIQEEYKEESMNKNGEISNETVNIILDAFYKGTPLPKGHGRLIDADVVKDKMGNLDGFGFIGRCVDEIPTVLEADKE